MQASLAPLQTLIAAVNAYIPASGDWGAMVWTLQQAFLTTEAAALNTQWATDYTTPGPGPLPAPNVIAQDYSTKADGLLQPGGQLPPISTVAADGAADAVNQQITELADTTALTDNLAGVNTAYASLGSPPGAVSQMCSMPCWAYAHALLLWLVCVMSGVLCQHPRPGCNVLAKCFGNVQTTPIFALFVGHCAGCG